MTNSKIIVILGPDGSGKSTFSKKITQNLKKKKIKIKNYHLVPSFSLIKKKAKIVTNPHAKIPRSKFMSILKLLFWLLKYKIAIFFDNLQNYQIIIFDRYADDLIIDPIRYRFNLNKKYTSYILKFFPKPFIWIIMLDKPLNIWRRKKEVKYKVLVDQLKLYKKFAKNKKNSIICNNFKDLNKVERHILTNEI